MKLLSALLILIISLIMTLPAYCNETSKSAKAQSAPVNGQDDSSVSITSPMNNMGTGSTVKVTWMLKKGSHAAHVHFYLDGKNLGPKTGDSYTLTHLKPGKHTILLKTASSGHSELGPSDSITITVQ